MMATIHQLARPARSRIACAMMCAHDAYFLASLAAPQPDLRPRSACSPYGSGAKSGAAPDTRGLLVVSISVRPRYSSAGLVKWYPIDDIIRVFDETFILRSSFFPLAPLPWWCDGRGKHGGWRRTAIKFQKSALGPPRGQLQKTSHQTSGLVN